MADNTTYAVRIEGLDQLMAKFAEAPEIVEPTLQKAIEGSQAILSDHKKGNVPMITGNLINRWTFQTSRLMAKYFPTVKYAIWVHEGTKPHIIRAVNAGGLANKKTGQFFGKVVHHPGNKPNRFMPKIIKDSQPQITALFQRALQIIVQDLAKQ